MISVEDLTVTRDGARILDRVAFHVPTGQLGLVRGASGSGKSTLMRILGGLASKEDEECQITGRVHVAGLDPRDATAPQLAQNVGQLLQHAEDQLLALDVAGEVAMKLENLRVPREEGLARVDAALSREGLRPLAPRDSTTLSGGEVKRVAWAAAGITQPPVLLLDEPLAGLSPRARAEVLDTLRAWRGQATILVAEHRTREIEPLADVLIDLPAPPRPPLQQGPINAHAEPPRATEPILRAQDLTCARPRSRVVARGLNVSLHAGLTALVGDNGAGKSTILHTLAGLLPALEGRALVNGERVHAKRADARARLVALAPQFAADAFTCATVLDELILAPRRLGASPRRAQAIARDLDLGHLFERHPLSLSGGERARLAVACALSHDAPLTLLDEPGTGLDADNVSRLVQVLGREGARGRAVLVATHDEAIVKAATRVLVLNAGNIEDAGTPARFLTSQAARELGWPLPTLPLEVRA